MNRRDLIKRISTVMRDNNVRKPVFSQRQVFHISDDNGNSKDFVVKQGERFVSYTMDDIEAVMDACVYVIEDALKKGEDITIKGFGSLGLHHRKARTAKHPETGEIVEVAARYVPKFSFGNDLRMCARIFEMSLGDRMPEPEPRFDDIAEDGE